MDEAGAVSWIREQNTGVEIIGVPNPNSSDEGIAEFISKMDGNISHILKDPAELWAEHGVVTQPAMVFVAADGTTEVRFRSSGRTGLLWRIEELAEA